MKASLRARLTVGYTLVFGLLLTLTGFLSYRVLAVQLDADATGRLDELTSGLHGYLKIEGDKVALAFDRDDPEQAAFVHDAARFCQVFDAQSGQLVFQSDAVRPLGLHFTAPEVRTLREEGRPRDFSTPFGRIRLSNSPIAPPAGGVYLLQAGVSLDPIERTLARFRDLLLLGVPAGLLAAALAGWWMARIGLAPLSRLAAAARAIDARDLGQRLPVRGADDELDEVSAEFNAALGRLERAVGEMRQFSTALAHELRTPLTALRGEIEMALLGAGEDEAGSRRLSSQLEEVDKLKQLIDRLLTLARAETGDIPLAVGPVDLVPLCASLVDQLDLVAGVRDVTLECAAEGRVVVLGDAQWLERLLLNLVDNALKFTPAGGRVHVRVRREGGEAVLEVADTGIGIAADVIPRVFERFFRAAPAREADPKGTGLGLSLVKWIVDSHNGRIGVRSEPGRGTTFTVSLPAAGAEAGHTTPSPPDPSFAR